MSYSKQYYTPDLIKGFGVWQQLQPRSYVFRQSGSALPEWVDRWMRIGRIKDIRQYHIESIVVDTYSMKYDCHMVNVVFSDEVWIDDSLNTSTASNVVRLPSNCISTFIMDKGKLALVGLDYIFCHICDPLNENQPMEPLKQRRAEIGMGEHIVTIQTTGWVHADSLSIDDSDFDDGSFIDDYYLVC